MSALSFDRALRRGDIRARKRQTRPNEKTLIKIIRLLEKKVWHAIINKKQNSRSENEKLRMQKLANE